MANNGTFGSTIGHGTRCRLTFDPANDLKPVWTPDGRRIVFASLRGELTTLNLYWQRADGTGEVQRLTDGKNAQYAASWHPSGKFLAFTEVNPKTSYDLMILPMEGDEASGWKPGKPRVFLNTRFDELEPMFSPDGRWLAYYSSESGRAEVFVRPFPGPGGKWQVSTDGGMYPTWSRTRHELFYSTLDQRIMVSAYNVEGDAFRADKPRLWSQGRFTPRGISASSRSFDLHPDGDRVALAKDREMQTVANYDRVVFMLNFFDEPVWLGEGQRFQRHGVEHAERRRTQANGDWPTCRACPACDGLSPPKSRADDTITRSQTTDVSRST